MSSFEVGAGHHVLEQDGRVLANGRLEFQRVKFRLAGTGAAAGRADAGGVLGRPGITGDRNEVVGPDCRVLRLPWYWNAAGLRFEPDECIKSHVDLSSSLKCEGEVG